MPFSVAEVEVILVADPVSAEMKGLNEEDDEKGLYEEDDELLEIEEEEELLEDAPSVLEGDDVPCCFSFLNLAVTVIDLLIFTVQVPAPLQLPPLQPEKE